MSTELQVSVLVWVTVNASVVWITWTLGNVLLRLVSTIPLPFCHCRFAVPFCRYIVPLWRSVVLLPLRVRTEMLETSFRIHKDEVSRMLIGCLPIWQNGKNRIRSYCYGTTVTAHRQVATATVQQNFSRKQCNSYGAYVILTEFT